MYLCEFINRFFVIKVYCILLLVLLLLMFNIFVMTTEGTIEYYYIINCICVLYVFHKFMFIVISYTLPLSLFRFIILNEFYPKNVAVITQVTTLLTKGCTS